MALPSNSGNPPSRPVAARPI
ncbi:Uncharacterized protein HZ326_11678, partial [Fusarium oxysporum f. sp. albedinis]